MQQNQTRKRGKRRRFHVAGHVFKTQKALIEHVRGIMARATPGKGLEGEDLEFMAALLKRHPDAEAKIGAGVRAIRLEPNPVWDTLMFVLTRVDGSETDFSYRECVSPSSHISDVRAACRRAVVEDIIEFKQQYFTDHADALNHVLCPLTGRLLGWRDVHVDHAPPWVFRRIVDEFLRSEGTAPEDVEIEEHGDGDVEMCLAEPALAERFRAFHRRLANLRVINARENLKAPK